MLAHVMLWLIILAMRIILALVFAAIILSLVMAGYYMLKGDDKDRSANMARALTMRITLSVALFLCIMLLWYLGIIQPTGQFPVQR